MPPGDMDSFVLEHRHELIRFELCTQALRQLHSPVPTGQGEREQALTSHRLDSLPGHLARASFALVSGASFCG